MSTNYYFVIKNELKAKEEQRINDLINLMDEVFISEKIELAKVIKSMKSREIHIGQSVNGSKFLFEKNEYFSNIAEFLKYHDNNKDKMYITDEYEVPIEWLDLLSIIVSKQQDDSRVEIDDKFRYVDDMGFEWANGEFS